MTLFVMRGNTFHIPLYMSSFVISGSTPPPEWEKGSSCHTSTTGWTICTDKILGRGNRGVDREDLIRKEERSEDIAKLQYLSDSFSEMDAILKTSCSIDVNIVKSLLSSPYTRNTYREGRLNVSKVMSLQDGSYLLHWVCENIHTWRLDENQTSTYYPSVVYHKEDENRKDMERFGRVLRFGRECLKTYCSLDLEEG